MQFIPDDLSSIYGHNLHFLLRVEMVKTMLFLFHSLCGYG